MVTRVLRGKPRQDPSGEQRRMRRLKRTAKVLGGAAAVLVASGGILWVVTPSAGDATAITRQRAASYHIGYPGPPVPANFSRALIATEDHRFGTEPGIDPFAVIRVASGTIAGKQNQGGATIEQQLAKMLYTPAGGGVMTEAEQVVLAVKLNLTYSKAQILSMYAEVAYYGHGFYGLQAASCGYFGHPAADLTVVQGAMLAGAVNAPTWDDPISHPTQARSRLSHVLSRMVAVGDLTQAQATKELNTPLGLVSAPGC